MKASERKIKQKMPFEDVPAYLRRLADAVERKTENLPSELVDLPDPIAKLEIRGKSRNGTWELKIKIKAESPPALAATETSPGGVTEAAAPSVAKPDVKYKSLKKRIKTTFRKIGESIAAHKLPEPEVIHTFMADSELMTSFAGAKYGEADYPAYQEACRRLAEAYQAQKWDAFKAGYAALNQLKKDCHSAYK